MATSLPMEHVSAVDVNRAFGKWTAKALVSPIAITFHGEPRLVLASTKTFEQASAEDSVNYSKLLARFKSVINQIDECFYALDRSYKVLVVNTQAEMYLGLSSESIIGKDLSEIVPETKQSEAWDKIRRVMNSGVREEFTVQAIMHGQLLLRVKVFPYDGDGVGVIFSPAKNL